jgi:class 3 adenylate cyclase
MTTDSSTVHQPTLETANVLFMDIVGFAKLLMEQQTTYLQKLQEIVRSTDEFKRAQALDQLVCSPTGDGMALSFFGDAEAPVRCAVEISLALQDHPEIKLRMGINSGLVHRLADINTNLNVSGGGIINAQRVMDVGDAGHILLSKRVADDIAQLRRWTRRLHDLGEAKVKHGLRIHIFNLWTDEAGNPEPPEKLRPQTPKIPWLAGLVAAGVLLILAVFGVAKFLAPETEKASWRTLTYSLTVQKMTKNPKTAELTPLGEPFPSAGQEIYGNNWEFHLNLEPGEDGWLYVLNEGPGNGGATVYNVLFPTPANNNRVAYLAAGKKVQAGPYVFNEYRGTEKLWIIWSSKSLEEIQQIFNDAAEKKQNKLMIDNPAQINTVRNLLTQYESSKPEVVADNSKKQTTIKSTGPLLISLLQLQHESY